MWLIAFEMIAALAFLLPAVGNFRKHDTTVSPISPDAASTLVTDGVYAITRNPMYVGMLLALIGFVLWTGAAIAAFSIVAFYFLIDQRQIAIEERALLANFGDDYWGYAERVPRWLFVRQGVAQ
jgi:protein-S-isoprenylcysteine O-methyltransferase Ste14